MSIRNDENNDLEETDTLADDKAVTNNSTVDDKELKLDNHVKDIVEKQVEQLLPNEEDSTREEQLITEHETDAAPEDQNDAVDEDSHVKDIVEKQVEQLLPNEKVSTHSADIDEQELKVDNHVKDMVEKQVEQLLPNEEDSAREEQLITEHKTDVAPEDQNDAMDEDDHVKDMVEKQVEQLLPSEEDSAREEQLITEDETDAAPEDQNDEVEEDNHLKDIVEKQVEQLLPNEEDSAREERLITKHETDAAPEDQNDAADQEVLLKEEVSPSDVKEREEQLVTEHETDAAPKDQNDLVDEDLMLKEQEVSTSDVKEITELEEKPAMQDTDQVEQLLPNEEDSAREEQLVTEHEKDAAPEDQNDAVNEEVLLKEQEISPSDVKGITELEKKPAMQETNQVEQLLPNEEDSTREKQLVTEHETDAAPEDQNDAVNEEVLLKEQEVSTSDVKEITELEEKPAMQETNQVEQLLPNEEDSAREKQLITEQEKDVVDEDILLKEQEISPSDVKEIPELEEKPSTQETNQVEQLLPNEEDSAREEQLITKREKDAAPEDQNDAVDEEVLLKEQEISPSDLKEITELEEKPTMQETNHTNENISGDSLDRIIDEELYKFRNEKFELKTGKSWGNIPAEVLGRTAAQEDTADSVDNLAVRTEDTTEMKSTVVLRVDSEEPPKLRYTDEMFPSDYSLRDDVLFLKFISNLNLQSCSCDPANKYFSSVNAGNNLHKQECPSSLTMGDIESIKVSFLARHETGCKRFLTEKDRNIMKNILKTAPYYQIEFYNRHQPYEINGDNKAFMKSHMTQDRTLPKRSNQRDENKLKQAILDDLKDILKTPSLALDPNLNRFPVEEFKFGEKYVIDHRKGPININEYPFDYPATKNERSSGDEERTIILNLLNDAEAWTWFTSICTCDVITMLESSGISHQSGTSDVELRARLLQHVRSDAEKMILSDKIEKYLYYFKDLMKVALRQKIDREREYLKMLMDGKLKREELFVDILEYRSKKEIRENHDSALLVIEMFKELNRNNRNIVSQMNDKVDTEDKYVRRDLQLQLGLKMVTDMKLKYPENEILEKYIQNKLRDRLEKEHNLIKLEVEFEIERCTTRTLKLFQSVFQYQKNNLNELDDINLYFQKLYPTEHQERIARDESKNAERNNNRNKDRNMKFYNDPQELTYDETNLKKERTEKTKRPEAQTPLASTSSTRSLSEEINNIVADFWNESEDKLELIGHLASEIKRIDQAEQSEAERASATEESYKEFKKDIELKIKHQPSDRSHPKDKKSTDRKQDRKQSHYYDSAADDSERVYTLHDVEDRYYIVEMPMKSQTIQVFHDSFYGSQQALAEITITEDTSQIRTNVEMKS